jgi:hypothetical protein
MMIQPVRTLGTITMGRKAKAAGEVNKSEAIRELLREKPDIKGNDAIAALGEKGIKITGGLFYLVKGKMLGQKKRRRRIRKAAAQAVVASGHAATASKNDVLRTIAKVKSLASEVGGLRSLKAILDALSE